jgi:hypothetical protein
MDTAVKMLVGLRDEALPRKGQQRGEEDGDPAWANILLGQPLNRARACAGANYPHPGKRSTRAMLASHRH